MGHCHCSRQNAAGTLRGRLPPSRRACRGSEADGSRTTLLLQTGSGSAAGPGSKVQGPALQSGDQSYLFLGLRVQLGSPRPSAPGGLPQERRCGAGSDPAPTRPRAELRRALRRLLRTPPSAPFPGRKALRAHRSVLTFLSSVARYKQRLISDQCPESESERGRGKTWEYQNSKPAWKYMLFKSRRQRKSLRSSCSQTPRPVILGSPSSV